MDPDTYAIMVHKLYVDRVCDKLLTKASGWISCSRKRPLAASNNGDDKTKTTRRCIVLDTPALTGVSQARRGFVLMLMKGVCQPVETLSPMARQNISWVSQITHQLPKTDQWDHVAEHLWGVLEQNESYDKEKSLLRVDVYPRDESRTQTICLKLQQACHEAHCQSVGDNETTPTNPFEGPISMTKSASKCSHRLTLICLPNEFYFGVMDRCHHSRILAMKLNHDAAQQIGVKSFRDDDSAGAKTLPSTVPVSRAYYKLQQVWTEVLLADTNLVSSIRRGTGVDLGASPGGWTQVLVHSVGMKHVIAVDPGLLGRRVLAIPGVHHEQASLETMKLDPKDSFSLVVCDASLVWSQLLNEFKSHVMTKATWTLPSVWVLTMKLPFKTHNSIQRNLDRLRSLLPAQLEEMAKLGYPGRSHLRIRFQMLHLMANSDSERTVIAVFEE